MVGDARQTADATAAPADQDRTPPGTRPSRVRGRLPSGARGFLLGAAASGLMALAGAVLALRLWRADFDVPFNLTGDINLALMVVRNMQVSGWFQSTPLLNAPLGQDLLGYPAMVGDLWNVGGLKVLSHFLTPAQTINTAFLLSFALISMTAFGSMRALGVSQRFAIALGAVYAWLPYHFLRGEGHLFLSNYSAIPIACLLALAVYRPRLGRRLWSRRPGMIAAFGGAAFLGGTGLYYAAFGLVLLASAGVLAGMSQRSWRPLVRSVALGATTGLVLLVSAWPNLLYRLNHGVLAVEGRSYAATEYFGLKITNLLLPLGSHRIPQLAAVRARAAESYIPGEGSETLGILGTIGLVAIVLALMIPYREANGRLLRALRPLGVFAAISILFATVAGLNGLLAAAGFAQLRAWNRMSVVIAFLALSGTACLLDAAWRRLDIRIRWPHALRIVASVVAVGTVALFGLADQTSNAFVPDVTSTRHAWNSDAQFFSQVQDRLGSDGRVFQLPVVPFPEYPPVVDMLDYEQLRGYIHSDLSWSYGGLKGGVTEWQTVLEGRGLIDGLPALVATGFDAVYVNRLGFEDRGRTVEAQIRSVIGNQAPLVNEEGTLAVYDLRHYAEALEPDGLPSPESVLYPPRFNTLEGFYGDESAAGETWQWLASSARAELINPSDHDKKVTIEAELRAASPAATVTIRIGADETVVHLVGGSAEFAIRTTLPAGSTPVTITTDSAPTPSVSGDARDLRLQLMDLTLTEID